MTRLSYVHERLRRTHTAPVMRCKHMGVALRAGEPKGVTTPGRRVTTTPAPLTTPDRRPSGRSKRCDLLRLTTC